MYKTAKTQTNLPVKICHLEVHERTSSDIQVQGLVT